MFFKRKSNVIYRDYGSFGYVTDNRNFRYKFADEQEEYIGDKVVSESGAVFMSVLNGNPQSLDELAEKIQDKFTDINIETIKKDALEFYLELEKAGFVASGMTLQECNDKDYVDSCKSTNIYKKRDDCLLKKQPDVSTQDYFDRYFDGKPQLVSLQIEIISKCNERCVHCYIPHEKKNDIMSSAMFYNILEQCKNMNVLNLTLSGGEPLAHNNIIDFLRRCNEYNFSINLLSNLTLLNQDIIDVMRENVLLGVQTSLYSMDANIHDKITNKKGSFEKTKRGILKLIENNIPVQISCPIMKQNMHCYEDVIQWGLEHNINVNCDYVIIAAYDHTIKNLQCRLSIEDVGQIINQKMESNSKYLESIERQYRKKKNLQPDDYVCSVCQSSICVSENGWVFPCAGWKEYILGDLNKDSLYEIWNYSEKVQYLRKLRRKDFPQCMECPDKEFCTMCMVRNSNEDEQGDPLAVNSFFCSVAKKCKELYFAKKGRLS